MNAVAEVYGAPLHGWTCFHCGETFHTPGSARDHFGPTPASAPGCIIKAGDERGLLLALRKAEAALDDVIAQRDSALVGDSVAQSEVQEVLRRALAAEEERDRLRALIDSPHNANFLEGVRREVAHQVERWGTVHDRAKEPGDWLWLLGFLASKALHAQNEGRKDKALHHCISSAAVLGNWHTQILLGNRPRPSSSDLQRHLRDTFGADFSKAQRSEEVPL